MSEITTQNANSWGDWVKGYENEKGVVHPTPTPNPRRQPNTDSFSSNPITASQQSQPRVTAASNRNMATRGYDIISNTSSSDKVSPPESGQGWNAFSRTINNPDRKLNVPASHIKLIPQNPSFKANHKNVNYERDNISTFLDKFPSCVSQKEEKHHRTKAILTPRDYNIVSNKYVLANDEKWTRENDAVNNKASKHFNNQQTFDLIKGSFVDANVEQQRTNQTRQQQVDKRNLALSRQPPRMHYGEGSAYHIINNADKDSKLAHYYDRTHSRGWSRAHQNASELAASPSPAAVDAASDIVTTTTTATATADLVDPVTLWNLPRITMPAKGRFQTQVEKAAREQNETAATTPHCPRENKLLDSCNTKRLIAGEEIEGSERLFSQNAPSLHNNLYKGKGVPKASDYVINGVQHPVHTRYNSNIANGTMFVDSKPSYGVRVSSGSNSVVGSLSVCKDPVLSGGGRSVMKSNTQTPKMTLWQQQQQV